MNTKDIPDHMRDQVAEAFRRGRVIGDITCEQFRPDMVHHFDGCPPYFEQTKRGLESVPDGLERDGFLYGVLTSFVHEIVRLQARIESLDLQVAKLKGEIQ